MSVRTSSDELRDDAKQHLEIALQRIYQSMKPNRWGSEEYLNDKYFDILKELNNIIKNL